MANLESNLNNLSETFDKLNEIRETSLTISRAIVRDCSKSIRFIHRNDINGAEEFIDNAKKKITELKKLTEKVSEISFAGYVLDAEREYVEAVLFYIYESRDTLNLLRNLMFIHQVIFRELGILLESGEEKLWII